jgi:hypothetical protein
MTASPSQTKGRRRWLIVAFVLVLVSLGTWWYWPRTDGRFVGKWYHLNSLAVPPIEFTLHLNDDGTGTLSPISHDAEETPTVTTPIGWWVSGNELFWLQSPGDPPSAIGRLWAALGATKSSRLRIVRVTDRQILWQRHSDDSDSAPLVLDRVE